MEMNPIPSRKRAEALRFLVGGRSRRELVDACAEAFGEMLRSRADKDVRIWWSRRGRRCAAVAMVVANAGRSGFLYHCPADAPGVDAPALRELVRAVSLDAIRDGMCFVQVLCRTDRQEDIEILTAAGYQLLANLVYMRLDLSAAPVSPSEAESFSWRSLGEFDEDELARVIAATYEGSLDCPALFGVRDVRDVIAGHKATGAFTPQSWWIAQKDGSPAGCILVNDSPSTPSAEIVYAGVAPSFRGRGVGRTLVRKAVDQARRRGLDAVTLAVDARNRFARELYERSGFEETDRRIACVMVAREGTGGV